jgi:hypothetical protein
MICPVCAYKNLPYPARDYNICPCCSTEFGNDDGVYSRRQLLGMWIAGGANWFFGRAPEHWNPWLQLIEGGLGMYVPAQFRAPQVKFQLVANSAHVEPAIIANRPNLYGSLALAA